MGLSGSDLFIAVLKRPSMEETAWTERYSLDVRHVKKEVRFSDWCIFEIVCEWGSIKDSMPKDAGSESVCRAGGELQTV